MSREKKPSLTKDDIHNINAANVNIPVPIKNTPLHYKKGSEIGMEPIEWFMDQIFPIGEVSLIAGEPGVGKSTFLMKLVALSTRGHEFKAGIFNMLVKKGNVVILSLEDKAESILKPRIIAAGGDEEHFYIIEGEKTTDISGIEYEDAIRFDRDLGRLNKTLEIIGNVSLIVIDPITGYLGEIDDKKNNEVRRLISKLTAIARLHKCAVLLNTHLAKNNGNKNTKASHRVLGSVAYLAAPRAVYIVDRHELDPNKKRKVIPVKNNYGDDKNGFAYEIELIHVDNHLPITKINLLAEQVIGNANEIMEDEDIKFEKTEEGRARVFLFNFLKNGYKPSNEVKQKAKEYDISERTLARVRQQLNVVVEQSKINKRQTVWYLSDQSPDDIS